jgi:carbon monoxide dehydrogenase subunit G
MKLENQFSIPVPAADAWRVLLDLERIAPCVPGATLTGKDGDGYQGKIKVKLGPVGLTYTGTIKIVSQDEAAHVAALEGGGRETRGNGTAKALVTLRLVESGDKTEVFVDTDLNITGKPAQFGRGTLAEVAGTLIGQFAANLAEELTASVPAGPAAVAPAESPQPATGDTEPADSTTPPTGSSAPAAARKPAEPIDLLEAAGVGGAKQAAPLIAAVLLLVAVLVLRRRRRARPAGASV